MRRLAALISAVALVSVGIIGLGNANPRSVPNKTLAAGGPSSAVLDLDGASARRLSWNRYRETDRTLAALRGTFVASLGDFKTKINRNIRLTYRFTPGRVQVNRGDRVTFFNAARLQEPHTITIARKRKLPTTIDEVFACGGSGTACAPARDHNRGNLKLKTITTARRASTG